MGNTSTTVSITSRIVSTDLGILIIRIALGFMMLLHGIDKIRNGVGGIVSMLEAKGLPGFMAYGAYVGEVLAPALVLVGFLTRPAAAIIVFNMLMAIALAHPGDVFKLNDHGGWAIELQMFYLLTALALVCTGAGRISASRGNGMLH